MDLFSVGHRLLLELQSSQAQTNVTTNSTTGTLPDLPIKLLETLVPGYSTASRFLLNYLKIDISLYVSILAFIYAANKAQRWLSSKIATSFHYYCTSTVHINGDDDLYELIVQWMAEKRPDVSARWVAAKTQYGSATSNTDSQENTEAFLDAALDENGNFNFSRASARIPPRYEPYIGAFWFYHNWKGSLIPDAFMVSRTEKTRSSDDGHGERTIEEIDITCVGRTTKPIKRLLSEIKLWSVNKQVSCTAIRSPSSADYGWYRHPWNKTSERPCRSLDTVILDPEQKEQIRQDINEFLHPSSTRWYASRGIPYRRGYLFHGPPGTGKTSLSFALAGMFGLDIYIVPLMDPELTEAYLGRLFNVLPRRCIVLLEDIDSAGVQNRDEEEETDSEEEFEGSGVAKEKKGKPDGKNKIKADSPEGEEKEKTKKEEGSTNGTSAVTNGDSSAGKDVKTNGNHVSTDDKVGKKEYDDEKREGGKDDEKDTPESLDKLTLKDLAKIMLSISSPDRSLHSYSHRGGRMYRRRMRAGINPAAMMQSAERTSNISLSGLLNVIDGVATHEGRLLIMTTNHPEKLDSALIRAGRVDMQIKFTHATREQIRRLFIRMYQADADDSKSCPAPPSSRPSSSSVSNAKNGNGIWAKNADDPLPVTTQELEQIAKDFADQLPEETFAPSDVQGFLLLHKKSPQEALRQVGIWKAGKLKEMEEKTVREKKKRERGR